MSQLAYWDAHGCTIRISEGIRTKTCIVVSWGNHIGHCASEGRHLVIVLLEQDIVALDDARHVGDKAAIAEVAFPTLLDKIIGVGNIPIMSDEFVGTG